MKWLQSRKIIGVLASITGLGTGVAFDDEIKDLVNDYLIQHEEVSVPPQECKVDVLVEINEEFMNLYCRNNHVIR